jgi:uncharacterized membrane protein YgcG
MMFDGTTVRSAALWVSLGVLAGAGITLGVILVGGVSVADEAGSPLGISVVTVAPDSSLSTDVSPTGIPTHASDDDPNKGDDDATVVPAPTPTEVELGDDKGGGSNSGSGSSGSNSGSSGSGSGSSNSGSGSGGSDDSND